MMASNDQEKFRDFGKRSALRTGPPGLSAAAWRSHRKSFKSGDEVRLETRRDPVLMCVCRLHSSSANKDLRGIQSC